MNSNLNSKVPLEHLSPIMQEENEGTNFFNNVQHAEYNFHSSSYSLKLSWNVGFRFGLLILMGSDLFSRLISRNSELMFNFDEGDMSLFGILVGRRLSSFIHLPTRCLERLRESLEAKNTKGKETESMVILS
ncbi:unnamed protein product [Lactuca virosa]|uniref:Uncharacterized protein n=1 Tax=Lactuca virosa TaxID=75947 RepID=A0AAU9P7V7_9ASTR|nr:unnamed protein product [Lactuca virosa]